MNIVPASPGTTEETQPRHDEDTHPHPTQCQLHSSSSNIIGLHNVPPETLLQVFSNFSNFTDVYSLAAVSRRLREVFLESQVSILKAVASRSHDLANSARQLTRALALTTTLFPSSLRHLQTPNAQDRTRAYFSLLQAFISAEVYNHSHSGPRRPRVKPLLLAEVTQLRTLWQVASALEPALLAQVQAAKPFLESCGLWEEAYYTLPTHVSSRSRTRIHNALYRMWTYQTLFHHSQFQVQPHLQPSPPVPGADPLRPDFRFLLSTTESHACDGIELHELLLLWHSLIQNRLFPALRFSLAVEVATGAAVLLDEQGRPCPQARGRIFTPGSASIVSRPPQAAQAPREISVSNEVIATITFLNQWPTNQWTMPQSETRIAAFLRGLARMLTPEDMLCFLNPSPGAAVPYARIRALATKIAAKFDDWADPATGRGTLDRWLNRSFVFPIYGAWGSFLFRIDGTRGRSVWNDRFERRAMSLLQLQQRADEMPWTQKMGFRVGPEEEVWWETEGEENYVVEPGEEWEDFGEDEEEEEEGDSEEEGPYLGWRPAREVFNPVG